MALPRIALHGLRTGGGAVRQALLGLATALVLAALAALCGAQALRHLDAGFQAVMRLLLPEFQVLAWDWGGSAGADAVRVKLLLVRPYPIGTQWIAPPVLCTAQMSAGAVWQPLVLALATALAWPAPAVRVVARFVPPPEAPGRGPIACAWAALFACLAGTVLMVLLAPARLASMMLGDIYWHAASAQIPPYWLHVPRFLEEGGSTLLGVLVGALCARAAIGMQSRMR